MRLLTNRNVDDRPHNVNPAMATIRVVFAMKNFSNIPGVCHLGLTISMGNTAKVLRKYGIHADIWPVQTAVKLKERLIKETDKGHCRPITHVVISSPAWVQPSDFLELCSLFPETEFIQLNHSGAAYLSIDKYGIRNIREVLDLEKTLHNMKVASNNIRVAESLRNMFGAKVLLLTNLYDTHSFVEPYKIRTVGKCLRIGSFGASRPWKNQLNAAQAAVQMARRLSADLEFYVNSKRPDGGERMIESRKELFNNLPGCKLIDVPWEQWPAFRRTVGCMDLMFHASFSETFSVITADGIAEGVPSVTSSALEWTPRSWWCDTDDPTDMATVGMRLMGDAHAIHDARKGLREFVAAGVQRWVNYLLHKDDPSVLTPEE